MSVNGQDVIETKLSREDPMLVTGQVTAGAGGGRSATLRVAISA
jgi:hypothetical protein